MTEARIVPFGKYKGQPVEALAVDKQYVDWLTAQPWFREKFQPIYNVVVNNFGAPSETPEHNAMQALFLDNGYVVGLGLHLGLLQCSCFKNSWIDTQCAKLADRVRNADTNRQAELARQVDSTGIDWSGDSYWRRALEEADKQQRALHQLKGAVEAWWKAPVYDLEGAGAEFEEDAIDVSASFTIAPRLAFQSWSDVRDFCWLSDLLTRVEMKVELKPTLGDEYPAVLRQMARGQTNILVIGGYEARGATLEQCTELFSRSGKTVVMLAEVAARAEEGRLALVHGYTPQAGGRK